MFASLLKIGNLRERKAKSSLAKGILHTCLLSHQSVGCQTGVVHSRASWRLRVEVRHRCHDDTADVPRDIVRQVRRHAESEVTHEVEVAVVVAGNGLHLSRRRTWFVFCMKQLFYLLKPDNDLQIKSQLQSPKFDGQQRSGVDKNVEFTHVCMLVCWDLKYNVVLIKLFVAFLQNHKKN